MTRLPGAQQKKSAFLCSNTTLSLILSVVVLSQLSSNMLTVNWIIQNYMWSPHVLDLQIRRRAIASFTAKSKPPSKSTTENQDTFEMISKRKIQTQYFKQQCWCLSGHGHFWRSSLCFIDLHKKKHNNTEGFQNRIGGVHQDKFEMLSQRRGET